MDKDKVFTLVYVLLSLVAVIMVLCVVKRDDVYGIVTACTVFAFGQIMAMLNVIYVEIKKLGHVKNMEDINNV